MDKVEIIINLRFYSLTYPYMIFKLIKEYKRISNAINTKESNIDKLVS